MSVDDQLHLYVYKSRKKKQKKINKQICGEEITKLVCAHANKGGLKKYNNIFLNNSTK